MPLNIKGNEARDLARKISRATGECLTQAVTPALQERLRRIETPDALAEDLLAIGRDCAAHLVPPWDSIEHGDVLFDDKGLPR